MRSKWIFIIVLFMCTVFLIGCTGSAVTEGQADRGPEGEVTKQPSHAGEQGEPMDELNQGTDDDQTIENEQVEQVSKQPSYRVNPETYSIEPISEAPENVVLLTIDDAPDQYALEMAKILKELHVGAIFFVNGHFLQTDEKKAILKEIYNLGFPIGNHTMNHENLKKLSEDEQKYQIVALNDLVESIIGERPKFFRAPFGANTDYSMGVAENEKMVVMNWTYGYDYFKPYMDAEKLTTAMVTGEGPEVGVPYSLLKPGANLLMHDREWTKDALVGIVTGLQSKGYAIVDPQLIQTIE